MPRNFVRITDYTGNSTTSTAIVLYVVLPSLPVLEIISLVSLDTAPNVSNRELPYILAWGVTYLQGQRSANTEVTAVAVNMLHTELLWTPDAGGYILTHF